MVSLFASGQVGMQALVIRFGLSLKASGKGSRSERQSKCAANTQKEKLDVWERRFKQPTKTDRETASLYRSEAMTKTATAVRFGVSIATISRVLEEKRKPAAKET